MAQIREEIRFGGNNEDLVWKSPIRDFNTGSVVIVNESQGAVFYMNGEASDELGAGLHILETCETPFIKRIIQKIQGTKTPFQAELYYVNKVEIPQLRWGVGEITYREEGFVFPIGARGMYNVRVENARKLIEK
ncbi:MAG: SPFH domain-containing protein, partial [Lachnospiraceae bacterium]|nr:SPFH domain-containing protein [Lachnospiraceae bacterium]